MTYRGARVRGAVRDAIRPSISEYFGFKTSSKERSVQKNIELVSALLMAGAFRYLVRTFLISLIHNSRHVRIQWLAPACTSRP